MAGSIAPDATRDRLLIVLSLAAGCVDAASFLGLGQVLTAAMTGNTVLLGAALGQGDTDGTARSAVAVLAFFIGALTGVSIVGRASGIWSGAVVATLTLELALLVGLAIAWQIVGEPQGGTRLALIASSGLAMGLQSAVAGRAEVAGVTTTFVTGTLVTLATRLAGALRIATHPAARSEPEASIWTPALVWVAYGLGAILAGAVFRWWTVTAGTGVRWSSAALTIAVAIVACSVVVVVAKWRRGATM